MPSDDAPVIALGHAEKDPVSKSLPIVLYVLSIQNREHGVIEEAIGHPFVATSTSNIYEDLVEIPTPVAPPYTLGPPLSDLGCDDPEAVPSEPHRLVKDVDAASLRQVLGIAQRSWEADVHHHRRTDNLGARLEVAERGSLGHGWRLHNPRFRFRPGSSDNASEPAGPALWDTRIVGIAENGGEGGIRTHGTLARTTVFETAPIGHSGTSPSTVGAGLIGKPGHCGNRLRDARGLCRISIDTALGPAITRHSRGWAFLGRALGYVSTPDWIIRCSQLSAPAANNTVSRQTRC